MRGTRTASWRAAPFFPSVDDKTVSVQITELLTLRPARVKLWTLPELFLFFKLSNSLNFQFSSNYKDCQHFLYFLSFPEHFFEIPVKFHQNFAENSKLAKFIEKRGWKMELHFHSGKKNWTVFRWNFEIWAVQKYENLVDLEKPEKMSTSIWLLS